MSIFKPFNRHILVEIIEEEEDNNDKPFLLPENYKKQKSPYALCKVLDFCCECKLDITTQCTIVAQRSMIETIEILDQTYYLVLENYVYGSIQNEID